MVRRRVTSSVKRCGAVAPLLCSIFLPARICRKATKLRVSGFALQTLSAGLVKDRVTSLATREDVGSNLTWSVQFSSNLLKSWRASSSADRAPNVP